VLLDSFFANLDPSFHNEISVHGNWFSGRHEKLNKIWFELTCQLQKPNGSPYLVLSEDEAIELRGLLGTLKEITLEYHQYETLLNRKGSHSSAKDTRVHSSGFIRPLGENCHVICPK
jgi:hypothetical protein